MERTKKGSDVRARMLATEQMLRGGKGMTIKQIINVLAKQHGIVAERKAVMQDLYALEAFYPMDVHRVEGGHAYCWRIVE